MRRSSLKVLQRFQSAWWDRMTRPFDWRENSLKVTTLFVPPFSREPWFRESSQSISMRFSSSRNNALMSCFTRKMFESRTWLSADPISLSDSPSSSKIKLLVNSNSLLQHPFQIKDKHLSTLNLLRVDTIWSQGRVALASRSLWMPERPVRFPFSRRMESSQPWFWLH